MPLTETPIVVAGVLQSFASLSIVRAGATASYVDASGVVQSDVAANTARLDHDFADQSVKGLLIEPSALAFAGFSEDISSWTVRGVTTVTVNDATAPDGTATADKVEGIGYAGDDFFRSVGPNTVDAAVEPSFFIKKISSTGDLRLTNPQSASYGNWSIDLSVLGSGWEWITSEHAAVTVTSAYVNAPNGYGGLTFRKGSGSNIDLHIWGVNALEASFPQSYIKQASGTNVTRNADVISIATPSQAGLSASGGAIYIESEPRGLVANQTLFSLSNGSATDRIECYSDASSKAVGIVVDGSVTVATLTSVAARAVGSVDRFVLSWEADNILASLDGATVLTDTDTSGAMPTTSQVNIGTDNLGANPYGGWIKNMVAYDGPLTAGQAQALALTGSLPTGAANRVNIGMGIGI